ncbi:MAG: bifunctional riboflavin kinase/FAD synthetase [Deltaproteobacteria bacterium]|nr:bifunctional riboflavin kinase/FAD synthetase [Deltaproteobacteria bacterium]
MDILRHIEDRTLAISNPVLTLGNFDGIHLGHQALLQSVMEDAKRFGVRSVVLTFEPHPLKILAPERAPRLILTHKDKMRLLQSYGVNAVIIQPFNLEFAAVEAEEFVQHCLVTRLKIRKIWIGRDLRFGKGRRGRVEDLIRWGARAGFDVGVVDPIRRGGVRVSSSRIRELIEQGDVQTARQFLGRYHFVSGRVMPGHQRGRELGFPTANIAPRTEVLPGDGIYATILETEGRQWDSVTNVGLNPTFGDGPRTIESFVFDFQGDLYGKPVRLFFIRRIRDERKFATPDLLVQQMKNDVSNARKILSEVSPGEREKTC